MSKVLQAVPNLSDGRYVRAVEGALDSLGGSVSATGVIGVMPDTLVLPAAWNRLDLLDLGPSRILSHRGTEHAIARLVGEAVALWHVLEQAGSSVPSEVREAVFRVVSSADGTEIPQPS